MKKILFNDRYGLTEAVLGGCMTQTRRIVKPQPTFSVRGGICWKGSAYGLDLDYPYDTRGTYRNFISGTEYDKSCKRYRVGEVVAVAQCYETISESISKELSVPKAEFYCEVMRAHFPYSPIDKDKEEIAGWYNKLYVRADLMPHRIRITDVRVERLQDISDNDCIKEGIDVGTDKDTHMPFYGIYDYITGIGYPFDTPQQAYAALIDSISGKGTWDSNPWVFVYEFELVR